MADTTDDRANVANADQKNLDGDALGDACDSDRDGDGVANAVGNCPDKANPDQKDFDGVGDACDATPRPACTKTITDGQDLDDALESSNNGVRDVYCIEAGTYPMSKTVTIYGDQLIGEAGTKKQIGPATDPDPAVRVTNGASLSRLFTVTGNATMKWLDISGGAGKYVKTDPRDGTP